MKPSSLARFRPIYGKITNSAYWRWRRTRTAGEKNPAFACRAGVVVAVFLPPAQAPGSVPGDYASDGFPPNEPVSASVANNEKRDSRKEPLYIAVASGKGRIPPAHCPHCSGILRNCRIGWLHWGRSLRASGSYGARTWSVYTDCIGMQRAPLRSSHMKERYWSVNASLRIVRGLSEARGNGRICKSKRPYCRKRPTSIRLGMDACLKA